MVLLMKAPVSRLRKSTCGNRGRSAWVDSMKLVQAANLGSSTYLPRCTDVHFLDHFSTRWAHAFFERHRPLHEAPCLLEDLAGRYGSDKKLGFAALDLHHFPDLGKCENRRCVGRIDGVGLGLAKHDHGCGCSGCDLDVLDQYEVLEILLSSKFCLVRRDSTVN